MGLFDQLAKNAANPAWLKRAIAAKQLAAGTPAEADEFRALMQQINQLDQFKGGLDPNTAFLLRKSLERQQQSVPPTYDSQMRLPGFAGGGTVSIFSDRRGSPQQMSHTPRNDKYQETIDALKAGMANWVPDLAGTPGDIADALTYAARKVAQGQSQHSVPSLGWGQASRAAVKRGLNQIPPPPDVPEMSAPYEPSKLETVTEMLNPALLNPAAAARGGLNALKGYGKLAVEAVARGVESGNPLTAMIQPMNIIKGGGGNWHAKSVEDALSGLRQPLGDSYVPEMFTPELLKDPRIAAEVARRESDKSVNNWIDKQLTRYVKNQMATPEDPVRALAEKGVLHYEPPAGFDSKLVGKRIQAGFPGMGVGQSPMAQSWEGLADRAVYPMSVGDYRANASGNSLIRKDLESDPWLKDKAIDTDVFHSIYESNTEDLGFPHLIDELKNALNPESGLPRSLLLTPQKMQNLGIEGAVQRVHDINKWRAAQKAEADALKANNAATVVHKEYPHSEAMPNPLGLKWVELKAPDTSSMPQHQINDLMRNIKDPDALSSEAGRYALQDALKYEGDIMGTCVGGYCDDVLSGGSRIFSLRDAKWRPHVTIETAPVYITSDMLRKYPHPPTGNTFDEGLTLHDYVNSIRSGNGDYQEVARRVLQEKGIDLPSRIVQIKGKQNRAPNPEYLPFVQDFVKSGQWSDVGDLRNAGLMKHPETGEYVPLTPDVPGFAHGGSVPMKPGNFTSSDLHVIIAALEAQANA